VVIFRQSTSRLLIAFQAIAAAFAHADGVAVFKEQPFHRDKTARAVVYERIIDSNGPWLRVVTAGRFLDVSRSKLVGWIELPGPLPKSVTVENDLAAFRFALSDMRSFAQRYPAAGRLLREEITLLETEIACFDAGGIRVEGRWMTREESEALTRSQQALAEVSRRGEIQALIEQKAMEEQGLILERGEWISREQAAKRPPTARTELSDCLWPLMYPGAGDARLVLENLASHAAAKTGAEKVRAESLMVAIRNLLLAERGLAIQLIEHARSTASASRLERNAKEWLKPNAFGTNRENEARAAATEAAQLRNDAATQLEQCRQHLWEQLRELDSRAADFYQRGEHRVALALGETVRRTLQRHFSESPAGLTMTDESLAAIRAQMRVR
jgi:hypothetical protein